MAESQNRLLRFLRGEELGKYEVYAFANAAEMQEYSQEAAMKNISK